MIVCNLLSQAHIEAMAKTIAEIDGLVSSRDKDVQLRNKRKELFRPEPVREFKRCLISTPKRTLIFLNGESGVLPSHCSASVRRAVKSNSALEPWNCRP